MVCLTTALCTAVFNTQTFKSVATEDVEEILLEEEETGNELPEEDVDDPSEDGTEDIENVVYDEQEDTVQETPEEISDDDGNIEKPSGQQEEEDSSLEEPLIAEDTEDTEEVVTEESESTIELGTDEIQDEPEESVITSNIMLLKHKTQDENEELVQSDVSVAFYLLTDDYRKPNAESDDSKYYYPAGGAKNWKGTVSDIRTMDLDQLEGYETVSKDNYSAVYNWDNGIGTAIGFSYDFGTENAIDEYIHSNYGNRQDEFSLSDVIWYVYKWQGNFDYHIDGYVTSYITYDSNTENNAVWTSSTVRYNSQITVGGIGSVVNPGHVFTGWNTDIDGNGTSYAPGETINLSSKLTLYAQWEQVSVTMYTVTYRDGYTDSNAGIILQKDVAEGSDTPICTDPERIGYTFNGWDKSIEPTVTENIVYTATWASITDTAYKVEYYLPDPDTGKHYLFKTENKNGSTGATATYDETIKGYELERVVYCSRYTKNGTEYTKVISSKTILGDGSLVIKLYYKESGFNSKEKIAVDITFSADTDGKGVKTVMYDGKEHSVNAKVDISADGEVKKTRTKAVKYSNQQSGIETAEDSGSKEISKDLVINIDGKDYPVNISGIVLEGGKGTDAGIYSLALNIGQIRITSDDVNVTEYFDITINGEDSTSKNIGYLKITPRKVIMTSGSASKEYDGLPITETNISVAGNGFADGEGAIYDITGSQTDVGESDNTFSYRLKDNTLSKNYTISKKEGVLTITAVKEVIPSTSDKDETQEPEPIAPEESYNPVLPENSDDSTQETSQNNNDNKDSNEDSKNTSDDIQPTGRTDEDVYADIKTELPEVIIIEDEVVSTDSAVNVEEAVKKVSDVPAVAGVSRAYRDNTEDKNKDVPAIAGVKRARGASQTGDDSDIMSRVFVILLALAALLAIIAVTRKKKS